MRSGPLQLTVAQRAELSRMATSRRTTQAQAARARIVLGCAEMGAAEVARRSDVTVRTVAKWRRRYVEYGIDGLADALDRAVRVLPTMRYTAL